MNTQPINQLSPSNGKGKKWTRASLIAAVAVGAITTEAANLILAQIEPEAEPIPEPVLTPNPQPEPILDQEPIPIPQSDSQPAHVLEPEPTPTSQSEPGPTPQHNPDSESEPQLESVPEPEPTPISHNDIDSEHYPIEDEQDNIVDVIVEEIDPQDIDMEDVLLVDDIGTVYTVDGEELNAALIHDENGNQAVMADVDNDHVYDVIATPEGEVIAQVPGDIDVSDVELLYAQQHGHTGYIEQNDFDIAMNEETTDIQDDISLT